MLRWRSQEELEGKQFCSGKGDESGHEGVEFEMSVGMHGQNYRHGVPASPGRL